MISSRRSSIAPSSGLSRSLALLFDGVLLVRDHCWTVAAAFLLVSKRSSTHSGRLVRWVLD